MKLDDENLDPSRPMECAPNVGIPLERALWATWEACARSYGHKDEVKMRRLFEEWLNLKPTTAA